MSPQVVFFLENSPTKTSWIPPAPCSGCDWWLWGNRSGSRWFVDASSHRVSSPASGLWQRFCVKKRCCGCGCGCGYHWGRLGVNGCSQPPSQGGCELRRFGGSEPYGWPHSTLSSSISLSRGSNWIQGTGAGRFARTPCWTWQHRRVFQTVYIPGATDGKHVQLLRLR